MQAYSFPTVETVLNQAVAEAIGSSTSSLTALQTTSLIRKLDGINREFVRSAHTRHHAGGWSWMGDVTNFSSVDDTTLNGAITTASTSFTVASSSFLTTTGGRVWMLTSKGALDFIDYTSAVTVTASGATDIDMSHASGEAVGKCIALPSTYAKARSLLVNTTPYEYRRQELLPLYRTYFTRGSYLVLPQSIGSQDCTFWFEKSPTDLSTGTNATDLATSMDIPEDFMWYAVYSLMAYIQRTRRKRQDAADSIALAEAELDKALAYDHSRTTPQGIDTDY